MLRVDVDSRRSARSEDVLHDLEVRFPNIYNRRRQRRARQEALQLSDNSFSGNKETSSDIFGRHDGRHVSSILHTRNDDVWSSKQSGRRRHSSATFDEKDAKLSCENGLKNSKWRLRSLEDFGDDGIKLGNGWGDSKSWDSSEKFPRRSRRNTSPDVLFVPESKSTALKERLKHNAERLNDLLYNKSPFSSKGQGHVTPRSDGDVIFEKDELDIVSTQNEENSKKTANGDARKANSRFELYRMMFENGDKAEKERKSDYIFNSKWRQNAERKAISNIHERSTVFKSQTPQQSPESQADSAIDVESASVQSELSLDNHSNDPNCDINQTTDFHDKDDPELTPLGQWSTNDTRSRPLHSLPNFVGDLAIRSLLSFSPGNEQSSGEESGPKSNPESPRSLSPLVSPKQFRPQGQTTLKKSGPVRGDHNLPAISPGSLSDREQQDIYLITHGFANGPLTTSADDLDDAVDDTDPSIESPQPATAGRVHTNSHRKQVYLVKTSSESPRYGRITQVPGTCEPHCAGRPSEGKILLDMRFHSFDKFSGKRVQGSDMKSEHHHLKSLKSKSLNDVFDGDMDTKYKMILQNGGPGYKFDQENNNEYCSSTDSPLKSKSCLSFNNFTLSPRSELEKEDEELIVVMDNIGESRTDDNFSDVQPSSESASISDHSVENSSSSHRSIPEETSNVNQSSETPQIATDENVKVQYSKEVYSSESEKFDQSFDSRTSDCDTEFFMEAEFLDSAMKPKKSTFQKLFGGKKGKYNPAAEDVSKLSQSRDSSKSNSVSKSKQNLDHMEKVPKLKHLMKETEPQHKAGLSEMSTQGKDVRFSIVEENDQNCVNTFNGGLVRAGRISAFEAATLKESPELETLNISGDGSSQLHSKPVVISSGKGSCLDLEVCNSSSKNDGDGSKVCKLQNKVSVITGGSPSHSLHKQDVDIEQTLPKISPESIQGSDSNMTADVSLKPYPSSSMNIEETIVKSPQSPDAIDDVFEDSPRSLASSMKSHQNDAEIPSFLSEGFDHHDSFDEKFHQDLKLNQSGSDFTSSHNTSNSPRSVWSEFEGPTTVDQSFEDSFDSSFNASSLNASSFNARSFGDVLSKEDHSKEEREKSSGYASENSPQSSETKDEFMGEEKSSQRRDDVARAPFKDEDVDRIFDLAKDPPSFADDSDIEEELSFADLERQLRSSTELIVVEEVAAEHASDVPKDKKVAATNKQNMSMVPKPILSNHSPRMASSSKLSKNDDSEPASITSDDNNNENSDDMGMSSETSEVIRSAFDFLGSSSEVEPLASARETLMMLEEEDSEEEQDLASSIKMLSDLRKSLVIENQDILLADGILTEKDFPDSPLEEAQEPSQPNISEDEDSSFQLDPRPAGVHSEIQVDIHRPNVDDSDNGSEMDAPLDAMDDDVLIEGDPMLNPNPENEVTTPKPGDFEDDDHPLNRTYVVSVDFCEDNSLSEGQTSFGCEAPKKALADELKLPLWDDDQPSSGYSTPRVENQANMDENPLDSTLEESSSDLNTSFKDNDCEKTAPMSVTASSDIGKDPLDIAQEETSEKRNGQRYIKKSQMEKKKTLLRRQKESIREEPNEDESLDETVKSEETSIREDSLSQAQSKVIEPETPQPVSVSPKDSAKDQSPTSDQSEVSRNFSGSFNRLSSGTGFYTDSVKEFSLDSGDSPRSLIQTDLPDASVNLSDEIHVNGSLDDVFFDDLNESFKSNHNHTSCPFPNARAYAYRKSSEGEDSHSMMSEGSSGGVAPERRFSLPDVVLNQGSSFMPCHAMSDSSLEDSPPEAEVLESSMENSMLSDIQEESYELSYNSFISPYATTKSLAKISSTPKSLYRSKTAELSCGVEPVYDPYSTIDSRGDNSKDSDRRCSSASDISPYATINDSLRLNDGVLLTSKDNVVEKSTEISIPSMDIPDSVVRTIPEIRIQAPTDDEVGNESFTGKDVMDLYAKINKARSKGDNPSESKECSPQHTASKGGNSADPVDPEELGAVGGCEEVIETDEEGPPLPQRKYERSISSQSNLHSNRDFSASRTSLFSNFKSSARVRFRTMRKAMSMDRGLDEAHQEERRAEKKEKAEKGKEKNKKDKKDKKKKKEEKISKAPSLKSLTSIFGKKSKDKNSAIEDEVDEKKDESEKKVKKGRGSIFGSKKKRFVSVPIDIVDVPTHFRCIGKLREVNPDGTQIVELNKPVDGPIGFYIAKGTANYDYGTFVSRFTDDQQKLFAGILGIGDEILEINEQSVKDMSLDDVHALMASTETLKMKIFPIVARKEV